MPRPPFALIASLVAAAAIACSTAPEADAPPAPLWEQPPSQDAIVTTSLDLMEVLEPDATKDACTRYRAGQTDRRTTLLCGKWMFFYETFGASGPPSVLLKFVSDGFPDVVGRAFEKLGMIADPTDPDGMPLGLARAAPQKGLETHTFTCASCHFARLPDGRYAMGAPNHRYDYGMQTLTFAMFPLLALGADLTEQDPAAVAKLKPMLDRVNDDPALKQKLLGALQSLVTSGAPVPPFTKEQQHAYATWLPGTQDFLMAPVPIDDGVHTVSKISALWGLPTAEEIAAAEMPSAMLGWTGGTRSLSDFLAGFVTLAHGKNVGTAREQTRPLEELVLSLRAPQNPSPPPPGLVRRGAALFQEKGCVACHDGPRGSGKRLFTYEEIGTDAAMRDWGTKDLSANDSPPTRMLKSPRLNGSWTFERFLHNGSVATLEDLFCLTGPRGKVTAQPFGDEGHAYTCDGLADDDKRALIALLRAN